MKTKNVFLIAVLLLIGSFSIESMAQENLAALVKKCESMESVQMSVVRRRDTPKGKITKTITSIQFNSNQALVNEFLAAFKKDEESATQAIDDKKNGRMVPSFYRFDDVSYSFSINGDGDGAHISIIERND